MAGGVAPVRTIDASRRPTKSGSCLTNSLVTAAAGSAGFVSNIREGSRPGCDELSRRSRSGKALKVGALEHVLGHVAHDHVILIPLMGADPSSDASSRHPRQQALRQMKAEKSYTVRTRGLLL